jgi:putative transport protein
MVGIGLGVIVGSIPFFIPGLPVPVRMGLAGGPLLVALAFGAAVPAARLPHAALIMIKELGIALFLAAVGIKAGHGFVETLMSAQGVQGVAAGAVITIVPLLIVGAVMVFLMKLRFPAVCGVLAGSMTDPPALAFAQGYTRPDRVAAAYATVYPATMIGRILSGQLLVILLMAPAAGAVAAAGHGATGAPAATSATAAPMAAPATAAGHP